MGDEQDRLPARVQAAQELQHFLAAGGVQGAGRLVGEQDRRLVGEGTGDSEPLAQAAREHAGDIGRLVGDAEQIEQIAGA